MILLLRIAALLALMIAVGGPAAWAQALESTDVTVDPTAANEPSVEPTVEPGEGANRGGAGGVTPLVQVASGFSDILDAEALPAGGAGLRYQLTRDYPMHLRLDYAWGRDDGILYFSVGEAF